MYLDLKNCLHHRCNYCACCAPYTLAKAGRAAVDLQEEVVNSLEGQDVHGSVDWVYKALDSNKDGKVSRSEFMELAPKVLKEALMMEGGPPAQNRM